MKDRDNFPELEQIARGGGCSILEDAETQAAQALDRLDELDRIDALRPPCPTCGGTKRVGCLPPLCYGFHIAHPCPDCVDGKVSIGQLVATYNAVWDDESIMDSGAWYDGAARYSDHLRSVKP